MIPPTYRRPLQLNAGLLAVVGLLLGYGYLLPERERTISLSGDGSMGLLLLLLLLLVFLVGLLYNGALALISLVKGREGVALVFVTATLLWGLIFYQLFAFLRHLGDKIGG